MEPIRNFPFPLASRAEFVRDVSAAVAAGTGYAAGKMGDSEKRFLYYNLLHSNLTPHQRRALELTLPFYFQQQAGLFPTDLKFMQSYVAYFAAQVHALDCVGLFLQAAPDDIETELVRRGCFTCKLVYFQDQEPDRSIPSQDANCYLPSFRGKRVLLICPFAELLKARATQETFEAVWCNTGKPWFYPADVQALEFPYGFEESTQSHYPTVFDLLEQLKQSIAAHTFDVALIAAGGMAIPLAMHVKQLGKVGISLGGHMQVLFGVTGKRWREDPLWRDHYFNAAWIDMPTRYKPQAERVADDGAYW